MTIIWLLVGLGLIVLGADWLVEGASSIARKAGVSEFVIGLTIVGFGTSCPELVVSLTGAFEGNADIAIGNVVGSKTRKLGLAILLAVAGLAGLIFGGNLFVDSATDFARMLGVSDIYRCFSARVKHAPVAPLGLHW